MDYTATNFRRGGALALGLVLAAAPIAARPAAAGSATTVYSGAPMHIGRGTARIVVRADPAGKPLSVAVVLSRGALQGLPARLNRKSREGAWEFPLRMPAQAPAAGIDHVVVDWNPHGHPPPHIYTVPHFDFHFYATSPAEVARVTFTGPADPAARVADGALVPPGYRVIPETAVARMGVHAVDTAAPEFHGKPFTATFIYGYYKGRLTFLEPMVTRAFLRTRAQLDLPVKAPQRYSLAGFYPTRYRVAYDGRRRAYVIELDGLRQWPAPTAATPKS